MRVLKLLIYTSTSEMADIAAKAYIDLSLSDDDTVDRTLPAIDISLSNHATANGIATASDEKVYGNDDSNKKLTTIQKTTSITGTSPNQGRSKSTARKCKPKSKVFYQPTSLRMKASNHCDSPQDYTQPVSKMIKDMNGVKLPGWYIEGYKRQHLIAMKAKVDQNPPNTRSRASASKPKPNNKKPSNSSQKVEKDESF
jgi:hypothetical protein